MARSIRSLLALGVLSALATAPPAQANVGAPWRGGARAGDPGGPGGIAAIAITREELVIDLRPLADPDGLVAVSATYHLDNPGAERQLDLVLAAGSGTTGLQIALDGRPAPLTRPPEAALPPSWLPPGATPGLDGGELTYHLRDEVAAPTGFQLTVPPGRHDLTIAYRADAVRYHRGEPTIVRQFAYVLAPARTWAGFGGLDVTVHLPPGWRAAASPALQREGDALRGQFPALPADALALTTQAPAGVLYTLARWATVGLFALVLLGGGFVVARRARARERGGSLRPLGLPALGRGLAWGIAVAAAGALAIGVPDALLPDGQADHRGYGGALAIIGVALAAFFAVVIGAIVSIAVGRSARAAPAKGSPD